MLGHVVWLNLSINDNYSKISFFLHLHKNANALKMNADLKKKNIFNLFYVQKIN